MNKVTNWLTANKITNTYLVVASIVAAIVGYSFISGVCLGMFVGANGVSINTIIKDRFNKGD